MTSDSGSFTRQRKGAEMKRPREYLDEWAENELPGLANLLNLAGVTELKKPLGSLQVVIRLEVIGKHGKE